MALTLSVADSQDGTGGVATVAGADPGTPVAVYRALFRGAEGAFAWEAAGSRTGDGTVALAGPARNYWLWYAAGTVAGSPALTAPVLQALTDATYQAVRTRAAQAIADRLALLGLADIPADRVYLVVSPKDAATTVPGAVVFRDPLPDQDLSVLNARDDVGMGFQVVFQDASRGERGAPVAKWDRWYEQACRAFRNQRLPGLPENTVCRVEPAKTMSPDDRVYLSMVSALTVRVVTREPRGIEV